METTTEKPGRPAIPEGYEERVGQLVDFIMKNCLWQFHSRAWDRKNQNEGILSKATQLLCGEHVATETPAERCYWVDAVYLTESFKKRYAWIGEMSKGDIKVLMKSVHEQMDFQTITGSLNLELTDQHY